MAELLDQIDADGRRLLVLGGSEPDRPIPQYPGWKATDLAAHTGAVYARTIAICRTLPQDRITAPGLPTGESPFRWFESNLAEMTDALRRTDPGLEVWSFTTDRSIGYWSKRMAIESALHRWDMEGAFGEPFPLAPDVARVGLDEFEEMWLPRMGQLSAVEFRAVDSGDIWEFGHGRPESVVEGTASEIYLRLMARGELELPSVWARAVDGLATPRRL